jgi:hypothetical protein
VLITRRSNKISCSAISGQFESFIPLWNRGPKHQHAVECSRAIMHRGKVFAPESEKGQLHALPRRSIAVCFTPVSGIDSRSQALPSRARSGCEQSQQGSPLFDHLIGALLKKPRHVEGCEAERASGPGH